MLVFIHLCSPPMIIMHALSYTMYTGVTYVVGKWTFFPSFPTPPVRINLFYC